MLRSLILMFAAVMLCACEPYGMEHYRWYVPFGRYEMYGVGVDPEKVRNPPPYPGRASQSTEADWQAFKRNHDLFPERLRGCVGEHDPEHLSVVEQNPARYGKWRGTYDRKGIQAVRRCMAPWGYDTVLDNLGMQSLYWFGPLITPDD